MTEVYRKRSLIAEPELKPITGNVYHHPDGSQTKALKKPPDSSQQLIRDAKALANQQDRQKKLEAKERRHDVKMQRAINHLIKEGLPINEATIKKQIKIAKEKRVQRHREQELLNAKLKKEECKDKLRTKKLRQAVIKLNKNLKSVGFQVNTAKTKLYKSIAKEASADAVSLARERLIKAFRRKKKALAHATSLSQAMPENPVRFGEYPLYLPHHPLAPWFPKPKPKELASFIYVLIDPNDNTVRYVGETKDKTAKKLSKAVYNKKLWKWKKAISFKFKSQIVAVVSVTEADNALNAWVQYYRNIGKIYNHK